MFHFQHRTLIYLSGAIWLATGCFLLPLGLKLLYSGVVAHNGGEVSASLPILAWLGRGFDRLELPVIFLVLLCVILGFVKGRFVLSKSVKRLVRRIRGFPSPTHLLNLYSPQYYLLLGLMILIGISMRYFEVPIDIRGVVDVVIGTALIKSAFLYFREARVYL